jgi:hypothetical protein
VIAQTHSRSLRNVNRRAAVQIPVQSVARRYRLDTHRRVMGGEERKYPRQGSLIRSLAREINGFLKVTSLNRTLFQGRPSPLAEIAEKKDRDGWRGGRFIRGTEKPA